MNRSRNERLAELFHEACGLAEGERARFVERECAGDPELRAELETLLAQDRRAGELDASARLAAPVDAAMERLEDEPGDLDDVHSDEILEGPTVHGRAPRAGAGRAPRELPGYTIVGELGSGGAGTVFEARQERMNRPVALKILSGRMAFSRKAGRRFQREAWIAGRLNHPNIVKVYESGSFEDVSYYSMELIRGGSLHDVIENMRRHGRDERLGLEFGTRLWYDWAINQIIAAARALDYTHREGVVHRDVKPMNLLLDHETATVKLADFGLAIEDDATRLTSEGRALGTLRYMSPEQLLGKRDEIDGRTDTYALAVTLFELLTLEYPYVGETYERYVAAVMNEDARRLTAINNRVSRDLEVVIGKALEKDRRDRYESAGEFADDLENVLHFRPIRARPPSPAGRARRWIKRRPVHAILLVTLAIALPLGGWMVRRNVEQRRMLREATVKDLIKDLTGAGRDPDKLIELGNRIVELDPHYEQGLYGLRARAVGYFLRARYAAETDQAATARESALADARRLIAAAPDMGWPRMLYAKFLKSFGRLEEAQIEREKGQNLDGDDEESLFFEALGLTDQENPSREDRERAQSLLTKILAQSERADAIELRARVRANLGDREGAIQDYRQLAQLEPDRHSSPRELGLLLTLEKRFDEGRQRLQRASELAPEDWSVWESLAVNAIEWGRERQGNGDSQVAMMLFREGEAHARRAVELAPEQPMPHINLGNALVDQFRLDRDDRSRIDESIRQFTTARELVSPARPEHQEAANVALLNVCDLMVEAGEAQSALETCLEATRALPLHPNGFYNLAGAYVLLGRNDDAFDALEKDFELGDYEHEWLSQDDWFEPIRDDPRFENLLARMRAKAGDE